MNIRTVIGPLFTMAALALMANSGRAQGVLDQEQWTYNGTHTLSIDSPNGYITFDQSVTAGITGLLTNVKFYADVPTDRVYFFVNQGGRNELAHLDATFVTNLARGNGLYNIDVTAANIFLRAGDVFSIGLVGAEGDTPAGFFRAAINAKPKAYAGALYYRYGSTGWLGLGYDDDMMFRTYVAPGQLNCFPQVAIGGGYSTNFVLLNNGAAATTGIFTLTDQSGNPFSVRLTAPGIQPGPASSLPLSMAPGSTVFLKAEALDAADSAEAGWACLESYGGSFGGVATYEYIEGGVLKSTVGVLASQPVEAATIPVDNDSAEPRSTAFAVANHGTEDVNIRIVILDENGIVTNTITPQELNPLGPKQHVSRYLDQYDESKRTFRGSMVLMAEDGKRFIAMALAQNKGLYTAIPIIPGKAPNVSD
jgi:hypothetical protein